MTCFRIVIEEVEYAPRLDSIEDVLRLREDKRLKAWRASIQEWAAELQGGNAEAEARLRKQIRVAQRDLKETEGYQKIAGLVGIVSLPVSIAETLTGVVGPGLIMTGYSALCEINARYTKWKNKWLLFGTPN